MPHDVAPADRRQLTAADPFPMPRVTECTFCTSSPVSIYKIGDPASAYRSAEHVDQPLNLSKSPDFLTRGRFLFNNDLLSDGALSGGWPPHPHPHPVSSVGQLCL